MSSESEDNQHAIDMDRALQHDVDGWRAKTNPGLIYAAMAKAMSEIGHVAKGRKNPQQGYMFRGIDEIYSAAQLVLAQNGICVIPRVIKVNREELATKSGGTMFSVRMLVDHTFYASDGSSVTARTLGEAMDSGDKASNKAMSAAMKYALIESFCIPTAEPSEDKNTEEHSHDIKARPGLSTAVDEDIMDRTCPECDHVLTWSRKNNQWECWKKHGGCENTYPSDFDFGTAYREKVDARLQARDPKPPMPIKGGASRLADKLKNGGTPPVSSDETHTFAGVGRDITMDITKLSNAAYRNMVETEFRDWSGAKGSEVDIQLSAYLEVCGIEPTGGKMTRAQWAFLLANIEDAKAKGVTYQQSMKPQEVAGD